MLSLQLKHVVKPFLFYACMLLFSTLVEYFMYSHLPYFMYSEDEEFFDEDFF
jgi:hypothetical protein